MWIRHTCGDRSVSASCFVTHLWWPSRSQRRHGAQLWRRSRFARNARKPKRSEIRTRRRICECGPGPGPRGQEEKKKNRDEEQDLNLKLARLTQLAQQLAQQFVAQRSEPSVASSSSRPKRRKRNKRREKQLPKSSSSSSCAVSGCRLLWSTLQLESSGSAFSVLGSTMDTVGFGTHFTQFLREGDACESGHFF